MPERLRDSSPERYRDIEYRKIWKIYSGFMKVSQFYNIVHFYLIKDISIFQTFNVLTRRGANVFLTSRGENVQICAFCNNCRSG